MGEDFRPEESAALFKQPEVLAADVIPKLEWKDPDEAGLIQFLVTEKGFNLERVQGALKRLKAARGKASQQRIEGFFRMGAAAAAAAGAPVFEKPNKRKEPETTGKKGPGGLMKKARKDAGKDAKPASAASKKK